MTTRLTAACLQINGQAEFEPNIATIEEMTKDAAGRGAQLILTPENTGMMAQDEGAKREHTPLERDHPALPRFAELAVRHHVWLLIGSLAIREEDGKLRNRSYLFNPAGRIAAWYDKIHLFDVELGQGESYRESRLFGAGDHPVLADLPWGRIGLTICYDVRFAHLYRWLAQKGARMLAVPAAFTRPTGEAHWHILLRARAIETGAFVLAPAQCGIHNGGRGTFGHSLIIDPWGRILAEAGEVPEILLAEIDLAESQAARQKIPALQHDRPIEPARAQEVGEEELVRFQPLIRDFAARGY